MDYSKFDPNNVIDAYRLLGICRGMTNAANYFKFFMMKAKIKHEEIDKSHVTDFMTEATNFIRFFANYAEEIQEIARNTEVSGPVYGYPYDAIKDQLYANYDFASILPFTDGLMKGQASGTIKTPADVKEYFEHTIAKAFPDCGASPAAVIDYVTSSYSPVYKSIHLSEQEVKHFNQVKHTKIYDHSERLEMYKAIDTTVEFVRQSFNRSKDQEIGDVKLYTAIIHSVVDYALYTMFVYAMKYYVIGRYVYAFADSAFVNPSKDTGMAPRTESATDFNSKVGMITRMHDTDEIMVRDMNKLPEFLKVLTQWMVDLNRGPNIDPGDVEAYHIPGKITPDNPFVQDLTANALYNLISVNPYFYLQNDNPDGKQFTLIRSKLRDCILNNDHGVETNESPKQQFLLVFRNMKPKSETVDGYANLALDLCSTASQILDRIRSFTDNFSRWRSYADNMKLADPTAHAASAECMRLIAELYRDFSVAILYKCRDIEEHINTLRSANMNRAEADLKIKVPGMKPDVNTNANMMSIIPDTTRNVADIDEMYAAESYAMLEAYDLYAQSLPGMENDPYYTEAVDLSKVINAIIAKLTSWYDKFQAFLQNKAVTRGFQWIIQHKTELNRMTFENVEMQVLPYKKDITMPEGFDQIITKIQAANPDTFKDPDAKTRFIRSLYPNDTVAGWFMDENAEERKKAPQKYKNYILFQDLNEVKADAPQPVKLSNQNIANAIKEVWVPTIEDAPKTLQAHRETTDRFKRAVEELKRKLANSTSGTATTSTTTTNNANQTPPSIDERNGTGGNGSNNTAEQNKKVADQQAAGINVDATIGEISLVIENIWGSMTNMFIEYFRAMYGYLQESYSKGTKH